MKSINFKKDKIFIFSLITLILLATFFRLNNLNYDDLWTDEIFSFWVSDPTISFNETLLRAFSSGLNFFFDLGLKFFHLTFGYDVHISRHFSFSIGVISFLIFTFLVLKITSHKSVIFGIYILCINLYHIKYSQELRSYILTFLFTLIFILLNFKGRDSINKFNFYRFFLSLIVIFMMYCNHAFTILVVASFIVFKFFEIVKEKKISKYNILLILSYILTTLIFLVFYYYTNLKFINPESLSGLSPNWLKQPKLSFYTNFYFSEFFGSRILGLIHWLILIFCIIKFRSQLFIENNNIYTFFVILLLCSYSIPLIFGYLFGPVLLGRFLIFLLIPIICLLCHFVFLLENKILKYSFITLIGLTTIINHVLYENTFRLYAKPFFTKPQVKQSLDLINNSNIKFFTIGKLVKDFNHINDVYEHYVLKYIEKKKIDIKYYNYQKENFDLNETWILYFRDIIDLNFENPKKIHDGYEVKDKIQLNRLDLLLLKKQR